MLKPEISLKIKEMSFHVSPAPLISNMSSIFHDTTEVQCKISDMLLFNLAFRDRKNVQNPWRDVSQYDNMFCLTSLSH